MQNQALKITGLIIAFIALAILLFTIYRLITKTRKSNSINLLYYIFGFAITSYIYPSGFKGIINILRSFFRESHIIIAMSDPDDIQNIDRLLVAVLSGELWYSSILFVCLFLLVAFMSYRIVNYITKFGFNQVSEVSSNNKIIKNLIVSVILILALYFSISSIIAVPIVSYELDDDDNIEFSLTLKEELESYSEKDTLLKKEYIQFIDGKKYLFEKDTNYIKTLIFINDKFLNSKREINSIFRDIDQLKNRALARMKITDNSKINKSLRVKDKSELSAWYLENRSNLLSYLNIQQTAINIYSTELLKGTESNSSILSYQQILTGLSNKPKYRISEIPPRPTLGSDLGVFTLFTGWLLSAESYPLVVIIGLIGFGLLGAAGSTFIRERENHKKKGLIDDLAGVIIKGFTAAIVVFLGVQGSLAVLTTKTGNLNAYALFFIAFVAAVFSEDAWKWAKKVFNLKLDTQ